MKTKWTKSKNELKYVRMEKGLIAIIYWYSLNNYWCWVVRSTDKNKHIIEISPRKQYKSIQLAKKACNKTINKTLNKKGEQ